MNDIAWNKLEIAFFNHPKSLIPHGFSMIHSMGLLSFNSLSSSNYNNNQ